MASGGALDSFQISAGGHKFTAAQAAGNVKAPGTIAADVDIGGDIHRFT